MSTIPDLVSAARDAALAYVQPANPDRLTMSVHAYAHAPARWLCQYGLGQEDHFGSLSGWGDTADMATLQLATEYKRWVRKDAIRRELEARVEDISE
jgi:hypothetical protein